MKIALRLALLSSNLILIVMGLSFDMLHDNFSGVMDRYLFFLVLVALTLFISFGLVFKNKYCFSFAIGTLLVFMPYFHVVWAYLGVFLIFISLTLSIEEYRTRDFVLVYKAYRIIYIAALLIFLNIMFFMIVNALCEIIFYMGISFEIELFLNHAESVRIKRD